MNIHESHLEHALIDVVDLDRSLPFYRRLLPDWTIRWEGRTQEGNRWVHFGPKGEGQPGYLSLYETPGAAAAKDGSDDAVRIEHIGFAHPDVDRLVAHLDASGVKPSDRMDDGRFRRVYFTDPDGHQLEFVQKLAAA